VLGDLPRARVPTGVQRALCDKLCCAAADKILACMEAGDANDVAARLATEGMALPEAEVGLLAWAFREMGGGAVVPARAAAAAATLVWRLHPTAGAGLSSSAEARATLAAAGGDVSRFAKNVKRAPFYRDVAGIDSASDVPTLLCCLSRSFAAAGRAGAAAVTDALARLTDADADAQHGGGECADAACGTCAARRAAGTMCALPTCVARRCGGGAALKLKVCARCGRAAYCSRACQSEDWARHRRQECAAAAAAAAATTPAV
jgi:hypothetical protein